MSYALIKACIEDQPATVSHLFAQTMAEKVGAAYEAILPQVGKQIGNGAVFDYDAINVVQEATGEEASNATNEVENGYNPNLTAIGPDGHGGIKADPNTPIANRRSGPSQGGTMASGGGYSPDNLTAQVV